jgi:hypothetical protein
VKPSWRTLKDEPIADLRAFVGAAARAGQAVHIGTDSQQAGYYTSFVTVLAILTPGKGGRAGYVRDRVPRITSLRERLLREVWRSVELALSLDDLVSGELTVHIDANPLATSRSSVHVQELVGLVVGQGFRARIKPESWAATHAADRVIKGASEPGGARGGLWSRLPLGRARP